MKKKLHVLGFLLVVPAVSQAHIINFNFTGQVLVTDPYGTIVQNNGANYTPIEAQLSYNTHDGLGSSNLSLTMSDFLGTPAIFHDLTMTTQPGNQFIEGNVLLDWNAYGGTDDMPLHVQWDATGLFNAIDYGLQAGDILSGTNLYRDFNNNGIGDGGEWLADIQSADPYADSLVGPLQQQGPAPLAATSATQGITAALPTNGFKGYFDIGSGNSMHVTSIESVPVPAAVWLFGSGLVGLLGMARRRQTGG